MIVARCTCGKVKIEMQGKPIASVACYCDDCQEGSRQLEALPGAAALRDAAGGTGYVLYRKDRIVYRRGRDLLEAHKLDRASATNRMVAKCCNAAMVVTFDDIRHWAPVYRDRLGAAAPALEWRICTKFVPEGVEVPKDVPSFAMYPLGMMVRLVLSGIGSVLRR